jgi:hypothetical protein
MEHTPALRIGDREREQVAEALRRHAQEGRLDPDELEARLDRAYAARTDADLTPLTADLPALDVTRPAPPARVVHHDVRHAIAVALTVDLAAVAIWAAAGAQGGWDEFWPKWVFIVTTLVLARSLIARGRRS